MLDLLRHPLCALERLRARRRPPPPPTAEAMRRHAEAEAAGQDHYIDPVSGRTVYTANALRRLGACCGLGCRHCPW
ncbi:MAG: hypothetical protein D6798_10520 [Deltaproteobacteria bacterium]|nr:MAG: hypothetical protein D6798_10520 [Deltaproteobacteria bacterium]